MKSTKNSRNLAFTAIVCAATHAPGSAAQVLEEIVVTAQKREQAAQDIGMAINAFSADQLRELGAASLRDVPAFTPNVELFDEYGTGQPTWVIRGVGLADFSANNTPTAAIYVDDVYMTSNTMGGVGLFDLARVEVLKGPQGALYGRNTSGGAVKVVSNRPNLEEAEGYASLSYGRWQNVVGEGAANLPLGDRAALRLSARWNRSGEGWQKSIASGKDHGEKDLWAARAQLLVQTSDTTEMLLNVHGGADRSETVMGRTIGIYDPLTGGFCQPILEGRLDDVNCASNSTFYDPEFRFPSVQSRDGRRTLSDPINELDNRSVGGSLTITSDFESFTLTSITAYEKLDYELGFDYDGGNGEFGHQLARSDIEAFSQELRLASSGEGDLYWMIGVEYGTDDVRENRDFGIDDDLFLEAILGDGANLRYDQETKSVAAYAQFDWQFSPQWKLGLGLRYTDEKKEYRKGRFLLFFGDFPFTFFSGLEADTDIDIVSGKLSLEWTPNDALLLYASLSRGFKSGGFFGGFPVDGDASIEPYKEETVYAWELGFKSQWLDDSLRLNGALFYYDYRDVQGYITAYSEVSQTVVSALGNQGDAEHKGAELELQWQASPRLAMQASISLLDAEIDDSDQVSASWLGTVESLEGRRRPFAPDVSYSLQARYAVPLDGMELAFSADWSWRDDRGGDGLSPLEDAMQNELGSYGLLGARISLADENARWELAVWGRNLADKKYFANVTTDDLASWMELPGEPRSYGVELRYQW